jgi:hypothetical protein
MEVLAMVRIEMRQCRFDPGNYWKRWAVLQYEQLPGDADPVLVGCRYFQTKGGAEAYKAKLEEGMADADRQEA